MLSRRPIFYFITAASITAILFLGITCHSTRGVPAFHSPWSSPLDRNERASTPLLGLEEIPAALWLPGKGFNSTFKAPGYNRRHSEADRIWTPLFIGFTRNYDMLEQTVLSYISELYKELESLMNLKWNMGGRDRNTWQNKQTGGKGERWTYNPRGFHKMRWESATHGQALFSSKWGSSQCQLERTNPTLGDAFRDLRKRTIYRKCVNVSQIV